MDVLYKSTVRSVIDYALPVYYNTLKKSELAQLDNLQYRAAKLVTGTFHFTNKHKLNIELGWKSIQQGGDNLSLSFFHKNHLQETRTLVRSCIPEPDIDKKYPTRSKGGYIPFKKLKYKFSDSFFPYSTILWNNLPKNVQCKNISDFKEYLKATSKPPRYKHFSRGNKISNSLLSKIRVGRSDLNLHKFTIGLIDSPQCDCLFREESSSHYFLDCFLYSPERRIFAKLKPSPS